jgi:hypothetical protein
MISIGNISLNNGSVATILFLCDALLLFLALTPKAVLACGSMVLYVYGVVFFRPAGRERHTRDENP